ncbi:MAG: phage major capsid protein [Pseudomonadota bacterium]
MPKNIKELRQQRSAKATRGKAATAEFNALAAKETRTDEEEAKLKALSEELDALEREVTDLDGQIEAEEKAAKRSALFEVAPNGGGEARRAFGGGARTVNEPNPETTGGFKALTEFALAVRNATTGQGYDPRLANIDGGVERGAAPSGYQQNGGSSGEGFLVPTQYREGIWELAFDEPDLLNFVMPEPTSGNSVKIGKDETTPWGSSGVVAAWRSEGSQMVASRAAATGMIVELHELYAFVLATQEVLDDGPRLQDRLTRQAAKAISWKASDAIMWGDGNGKPLGFMNSGAVVTVAKESGQAADSLAVKNILKMNSRVLRAGGRRPIFLANSDVDPELGTLTIGDAPAFLPNNQPLTSPYEGTLRGKPLLYTEHCKALGDLGDIALCDFSGYYMATKQGGGVDFAASIHLFFDYNIQAFRWIFRMGGQPYLSAPVDRANSANKKSHFVTLAERA